MHKNLSASQRFWDFSVALYSAEGVSSTCIHMQDCHGVDVNMLLLSIWRGMNDPEPLTPDAMNSLAVAGHRWQRQIIIPLRTVRRRLKSEAHISPNSKQLYGKALEFELACEKAEQLMLVQKLDLPELELTDRAMTASHAAVIAQNIVTYLTSQSIRLTSADFARLRIIFNAAARDIGGAIFAEFERLSR